MKDFNFLPKGYIQNSRLKRSKKWIKKIIIPYLVGISIMMLVPIGMNIHLSMSKKRAQNNVTTDDYYKKKNDRYRILQKIYQQRDEQAQMLDNYGIDPTHVVKDLQGVMPDNMYIKYLRMSRVGTDIWNISMSCVAATQEDAATFLEVLRKDKRYYKGQVSNFTIDKNDTTQFSFSCTYETSRS